MTAINNLKDLTTAGKLQNGDTITFTVKAPTGEVLEMLHNVYSTYFDNLEYKNKGGVFKYLKCGTEDGARHKWAKEIYQSVGGEDRVSTSQTFPEYANMTQAYAIAKAIYTELATGKTIKLPKVTYAKIGELTTQGVVVSKSKNEYITVQTNGTVNVNKVPLKAIDVKALYRNYKKENDPKNFKLWDGEKLYKVVSADKKAFHSTSYQFGDDWEPVVSDIRLCERGYHVCKGKDLKEWCGLDSSRRVYEVEAKGKFLEGSSKLCFQTIKLGRLVPFKEVLNLVYGTEYK